MSIYQKKDGRWLCRYYQEGKSKKKYFGRGPEGQQKAEDFNTELKKNGTIQKYIKQPSLTTGVKFEELATEYLTVKGHSELSKSSLSALEYKLGSIILPALGHLQAASITHKRLDEYVIKRLSTQKTVLTGSKDKPKIKTLKNENGTIKYISRSTVHRELCDIQAIFNWAVSKKYLLSNPVIRHKKPKLDNAILKPPTKKETLEILAQCAPHLVRALKISYFTGLRPGAEELFRLKWTDVDFEEETIFIVSAKKNGLPFRTVPIHDELLQDLFQWNKEDQDKPVQQIITYKNKPIKRIKNAYTAAKRRAGITRRIRLYDFRHAFATNLLSAEGDLKTVSEMLGHSRTDTTTRIYHHTSAALQRKEIKKLPGLKPTITTPSTDSNILIYEDLKKKNKKIAKK